MPHESCGSAPLCSCVVLVQQLSEFLTLQLWRVWARSASMCEVVLAGSRTGSGDSCAQESEHMLHYTIEIPIQPYLECLAMFPTISPEYDLLKNGTILRNGRDKIVVQLRCDFSRTQSIRNLVLKTCPDTELEITVDHHSQRT
jgi:hypothetical protein